MTYSNANFTPSLKGYSNVKPFRFWCQKVLPLVYDDSLSYYELLCKVVDYLNHVIDDLSATEDNVGDLLTAYNQLQDYVNNYFTNLDVQEEINNKLDAMFADGTIPTMIEEYVHPFIVELNENYAELDSQINETMETQNENIATLTTRVNNLVINNTTNLTGYDVVTVESTTAQGGSTVTENIPVDAEILQVCYSGYNDTNDAIKSDNISYVSTPNVPSSTQQQVIVTITDSTDTRFNVFITYAVSQAIEIAELTDIRIGYDNTVYSSAGNAVRGQIKYLDDGLYDKSSAPYSIIRNPTETYPLGWRVGAVNKTTGGLNYNTTNYLFGLTGTTGFFEFPNEYTIQMPSPYKMDVFEYNGSFTNANYITHYDGVTNFTPKKGKVYRIQIGNFNGEASTYLTETFLQSVIVTETINNPIFVDKTTYNLKTALYDTEIEELQNTVSGRVSKYIGRFGNPIYKLPVTNTPESLAFLGNNTYLWCADDSKVATQNMRMVVYENGYDSAPTTKRITHTLGHLNTVDYKNGALIFGNGGSGNYNDGSAQSPNNGYIYIIENFIEKFEEHLANGTTMTLSDAISIECDIATTEYANDSKFNVIFGETNFNYDRDTRNNIIYLVTSTLGQNLYNTKIRRILLGLGTNQLEKGTFISGKDTNEFNGTYKILNTYLGESDGTDYPNDMTFVNGNIISNVGETNIRVQIFTLDDSNNRIVKHERNYARFNDDGNSVGTNQWSAGITFDDINNYVFIGFSSSGGIFIYNANSIGV